MAKNKIITLNKIRRSLLEQLEKKGCKTPFFEGLVADYIYYEEQERAMKKDVEDRGATYTAISAQGKVYDKDNPSVKAAVMYNKQKLAILKQMGLSVENVLTDDDDEDSEL